jgi:hypothetical protein
MVVNGIGKIDLVIMNLYPFADTGKITIYVNHINHKAIQHLSTIYIHAYLHITYPKIVLVAAHAQDFDMCIENIDIGGPSMLRYTHTYTIAIACGSSYLLVKMLLCMCFLADLRRRTTSTWLCCPLRTNTLLSPRTSYPKEEVGQHTYMHSRTHSYMSAGSTEIRRHV